MTERLQKILSEYGFCSRRAAETWIAEGRVSVNGKRAAVGDKADPDTDRIVVNGERLPPRPGQTVALLNKPRGVVTTLADEKGRKTVRDLLPSELGRLMPVGRLDYNTEGLLLLTNDGALIDRLTHPSHQVEKEYHARVKGDLTAALPVLQSAMVIEGYRIRPAKVRVLDPQGLVSVTIHEGRHHQVRLMCKQAGLEVVSLRRVAVGALTLRDLRPGEWRLLEPEEIKRL